MDATQLADLAAQLTALKLQVANTSPSYWPAIITGFFTLVAALSGGYLLESLRYRRQREAVRIALVAEVKAMAKIVVARRYLALLSEAEITSSFVVIVPESYSPVFTANVQNIGLLDEKHAHAIVTFHQYIESVVQDLRPGGTLSESWVSPENFKETRLILRDAVAIAGEL